MTGLVMPACGANVMLAWQANTETNLAGYRVFYGTQSGNYATAVDVVAPGTSTTLANLQVGTKYYFALTAVTSDELQSEYSDEISYTVSGSRGVPEVVWLAQGTYNGLFNESDEVRHERSGIMTVTATARGTYSGKVQIGGRRYGVKGLLNSDAKATNVVLRLGLSPITVEVALTNNQLTGRVTDGTWTAPLAGDGLWYHSKTNPAPFARNYTIILPPDPGAPDGPLGDGYGIVKIDSKGVATFVGMLADGTKATQKVPLSRDGIWPFYLNLYRGTGSALGWLGVTNSADEVGGLVSWIKATTTGRYYANGLTNEAMVAGSTYTPPTPEERQGGARQRRMTCVGANLSEEITGQLLVLPNGKMVSQLGGAFKFGMSPTTGLFRGTVIDVVTGERRAFSGVMLQKWDQGRGLVLGTDEIGAALLSDE